nr:reverse transcriptase domain-containing protein [Tanacetum cinerariifolium]
VVENEPEVTKDIVNPTNNESTEDVQPLVVQSKSPILNSKPVTSPISEPVIAPVSALKPNPKTSIPYPSRRNDERNHEKANNQIEKFYQIFKDMSMAECLALAYLDASINLMPFSVWKRLSLPDLTPTCITLKLVDRLISRSVGIAEDVYVKVGSFGFFDTISSGNPTSFYDLIISMTSLTLTLFRNSDFLLEEVDAFLAIEDEPTSSEFYQPYLDPQGDILLLEAFLNDDPSLPPPNQRNYLPEVDLPPHLEYAFLNGGAKLPVIIAKDLSVEEKTALITRICIDYRKLNEATRKDHFPLPFMDQMLERLAGNQYYCFLDGFSGYFQIPIDLKDQEKTTFTCPYGTFAYRRMPFGLCNAPGTFQSCLSYLERMLKRCEDTNLCLNWEKSHFMVKEDWDMPFVLMCDASDFAIGAVLGQRQDEHFRPIHYASKTMTEAESNYTTTKKEMLPVVYAFEKF